MKCWAERWKKFPLEDFQIVNEMAADLLVVIKVDWECLQSCEGSLRALSLALHSRATHRMQQRRLKWLHPASGGENTQGLDP